MFRDLVTRFGGADKTDVEREIANWNVLPAWLAAGHDPIDDYPNEFGRIVGGIGTPLQEYDRNVIDPAHDSGVLSDDDYRYIKAWITAYLQSLGLYLYKLCTYTVPAHPTHPAAAVPVPQGIRTHQDNIRALNYDPDIEEFKLREVMLDDYWDRYLRDLWAISTYGPAFRFNREQRDNIADFLDAARYHYEEAIRDSNRRLVGPAGTDARQRKRGSEVAREAMNPLIGWIDKPPALERLLNDYDMDVTGDVDLPQFPGVTVERDVLELRTRGMNPSVGTHQMSMWGVAFLQWVNEQMPGGGRDTFVATWGGPPLPADIRSKRRCVLITKGTVALTRDGRLDVGGHVICLVAEHAPPGGLTPWVIRVFDSSGWGSMSAAGLDCFLRSPPARANLWEPHREAYYSEFIQPAGFAAPEVHVDADIPHVSICVPAHSWQGDEGVCWALSLYFGYHYIIHPTADVADDASLPPKPSFTQWAGFLQAVFNRLQVPGALVFRPGFEGHGRIAGGEQISLKNNKYAKEFERITGVKL